MESPPKLRPCCMSSVNSVSQPAGDDQRIVERQLVIFGERHGAVPGGDHAQFVAFLEPKFIDESLRQSNRKAATPFGNSHRSLHDILL
jgi:hypothetical protein